MQTAPIPANEQERIAAVHELNVLDTAPEERFDRLTRMARRLFGVPMATVTLVDTERQWFKSRTGIAECQTSRDVSFCGHAILEDRVMIVPDALLDGRFADNPLVTGDPMIRFYAGCPLKVGGHNVGTLCVIDTEPREFSEEEVEMLKDLALMAEDELTAMQEATTDFLTGLSNRRGFEVLGEQALAVSKRYEQPATLLYFDLNRFKELNDTLGHAAGDGALKSFAEGLLAVFRESDVVGRLGGDEFAVLLSGTSREDAGQAVERLREWLDRNRLEGGTLVEFSVGRAEYDAARHGGMAPLMAEADAAMYEQKKASRRRRPSDTASRPLLPHDL